MWLFGGEYPGKNTYLNDLWQFDPVSKEWTWVNGSVSEVDTLVGVFGTKGVAAKQNQPGGRQYATSWRDASGKFWLFGGFNGYGTQVGTNGVTNDLWRFDPSTRQWTWMGGDTTPNGIGKYGRQGRAAAENQPGARFGAISWVDKLGKFWLFGGQGLDANGFPHGYGYMNDLWQFDPVSGQWAWMAGQTTTSTPEYGGTLTVPVAGVYGTQGVSSSKNLTGARLKAASWSDASGRLWMFGGVGYDSQGREHALNDLWRFDPSNRRWTWIDGAAAMAVCQRLSCATAGNSQTGQVNGSALPVPRFGGVTWTTAEGKNWLFGGLYLNADDNPETLNDVWSFRP